MDDNTRTWASWILIALWVLIGYLVGSEYGAKIGWATGLSVMLLTHSG